MFNNTDIDRKINREMQEIGEKKHQNGDSHLCFFTVLYIKFYWYLFQKLLLVIIILRF